MEIKEYDDIIIGVGSARRSLPEDNSVARRAIEHLFR
jgi:hypothetical protein